MTLAMNTAPPILLLAALALGSASAAAQPSAENHGLAKPVYDRHCAPCHGQLGRGDGEAAWLLYPRPRDFASGKYALVSTWERNPTDDDLFSTITRGMPGSAMPSWGHLPEKTRWALVAYIKSLASEPWPEPAAEATGEPGRGVIELPPEPPWDAAARVRARELFADACAACHGPEGKGDGVTVQVDDRGYPTRPRDLTAGVFKGDPAPGPLYRRIVAGMPGTPMPMSDWAHGDDAWHLVHLIRSMSSEEQRARVEMRKALIEAPRVAQLPDHPDSWAWTQAAPSNLHLMPLWWRAERPEEITVRALHDGRDLALLLTWTDDTHDHTAIRVQDFRDAVAVEISPSADPPFFGMGERGEFVEIWMWKSERQADLEPVFQDLDKIYPNIGIDSYPNSLRSALEQPTRHALTLESDPVYVTGWGAGNIVSDPTSSSASEDLRAQGFGTLRASSAGQGEVRARGVYATGTYRVMFGRALAPARRDLQARGPAESASKGGDHAVPLQPGRAVPVAFAVWNGSAGDRDGKKSVTIWQELRLLP